MTKKELEKYLTKTTSKIRYQKLDGSVRTMICTTNWDVASKDSKFNPPKGTKKRKSKTRDITVWDLEKRAYRSIIPENVLEIL